METKVKRWIKDRLGLLLMGFLCSIAALCYWHFLGLNGGLLLACLLIVSLTCDNRRLRKKLEALTGQNYSPSTEFQRRIRENRPNQITGANHGQR